MDKYWQDNKNSKDILICCSERNIMVLILEEVGFHITKCSKTARHILCLTSIFVNYENKIRNFTPEIRIYHFVTTSRENSVLFFFLLLNLIIIYLTA